MAQLFSDAWMKQFAKAWNNDPKMVMPLANAQFSSNVAYGFTGEEKPRGIIVIKNGKVEHAGLYADEPLNWDLRASFENWRIWLESGFGLSRLGPAVAMGKLKFVTGDYRKMIRNPATSAPFLRHFVIMSEIKTTFK